MFSDDEFDSLLPAQTKRNWQKVATVIAKAASSYETWDSDRVGQRMIAFVDSGKLDADGDDRNWRRSEVRLCAHETQ